MAGEASFGEERQDGAVPFDDDPGEPSDGAPQDEFDDKLSDHEPFDEDDDVDEDDDEYDDEDDVGEDDSLDDEDDDVDEDDSLGEKDDDVDEDDSIDDEQRDDASFSEGSLGEPAGGADEELDDAEFATVATAATVEDAKRKALAQLRKIVPGVVEDDVEYEVMEEGSRGGFFGRGRAQAQVEAHVRPRAERPDAELPLIAEDLREFLSEVVARMGLEAGVDVEDDGECVTADLDGPDLGILIGRHGQTIDALQYIAAIAVNRRRKSRRRVIVDAEGYRDRRATSLHSMADRVAQRVARDREPVTLKPMSAAERKVIHLRLKDHPRVETVSEGHEPNRAVTIAPRGTGERRERAG